MSDFRFRYALISTLLAAGACAAPASAAVLALATTARGDKLHVIDVVTHNSTVLEAASCCAVQAGSVAADTANDRVLFLVNHSGGGADLYTFGYGISATLGSVPLSTAARVTHLAYDAANARLLGFTAEDAGGIAVVTVAPNTGNVVTINTLGPACCALRAGVIAYRSGTLYAVGRRSTDANDQLLVFSSSTGALQTAYDLGNERIAQLVADGTTLYALSYAQDTALLRPAMVAFTPSFHVAPIGAGTSDCCFVFAGSAAVDHGNNTLVALTRAVSSAGPFAIRTFSLTTGNATVGNTVPALGLFEDSAVLFDRIFADSFE